MDYWALCVLRTPTRQGPFMDKGDIGCNSRVNGCPTKTSDTCNHIFNAWLELHAIALQTLMYDWQKLRLWKCGDTIVIGVSYNDSSDGKAAGEMSTEIRYSTVRGKACEQLTMPLVYNLASTGLMAHVHKPWGTHTPSYLYLYTQYRLVCY